MSDEPFGNEDLMDWHRSQGGFAGNPAGHALRMLRECVELCVASGATRQQIIGACDAEIIKAEVKEEFCQEPKLEAMTEELCDVVLLAIVFQGYFSPEMFDFEKAMNKKFRVCQERQWEADGCGVLWRPGAKPVSTHGEDGKAPKTG